MEPNSREPAVFFFDGPYKPTLEQMQRLVGGYIELVRLPGNRQLIVNEDGIHLGLRINRYASALANQIIVGDALLLSGPALLD